MAEHCSLFHHTALGLILEDHRKGVAGGWKHIHEGVRKRARGVAFAVNGDMCPFCIGSAVAAGRKFQSAGGLTSSCDEVGWRRTAQMNQSRNQIQGGNMGEAKRTNKSI